MKTLICLLLFLTGCSTIEPNDLHLGVEHLSSITQHFGHGSTDNGLEAATFSAEWRPTRYTYIELQDGYIVAGSHFNGKGGREVFQARVGLTLPLKP